MSAPQHHYVRLSLAESSKKMASEGGQELRFIFYNRNEFALIAVATEFILHCRRRL